MLEDIVIEFGVLVRNRLLPTEVRLRPVRWMAIAGDAGEKVDVEFMIRREAKSATAPVVDDNKFEGGEEVDDDGRKEVGYDGDDEEDEDDSEDEEEVMSSMRKSPDEEVKADETVSRNPSSRTILLLDDAVTDADEDGEAELIKESDGVDEENGEMDDDWEEDEKLRISVVVAFAVLVCVELANAERMATALLAIVVDRWPDGAAGA